jgi:phosphate transport system substrate-binding protein
MRVNQAIAAVAGLLVVLAGCAATTIEPTPTPSPTNLTADTAPHFALADLPQLDGSTANIPLCSALVQRLTGVGEAEADAECDFSTTPTAYLNMIYSQSADEGGTAPALLLVYQADESVEATIEGSGVELEYHPIGRDALVFLVNRSNPVEGLTTDQIRSIYTGETENWSEVGGANQTIIAYQRPDDSGSQALMRKLVMGDRPLVQAPSELITSSMGGLVEGVASYANQGNALGYSVFYYVNDMLTVPEIKLLAVDGVIPTKETIRDSQYPHINQFFAVVRADQPEGSPARQILDWLQTSDGAQLIADAGYVGLAP